MGGMVGICKRLLVAWVAVVGVRTDVESAKHEVESEAPGGVKGCSNRGWVRYYWGDHGGAGRPCSLLRPARHRMLLAIPNPSLHG